MIKLSKTESTRFNKIKNLLVKILGFGKKDIVECIEGQPFGIDSRPIKGQIAIIARTTGQEDVVLGYITKDRIAQVGETRLYSTDSNGALKAYVWAKNNGALDLNGESNGGLIKIQDLVDAINNIIGVINYNQEIYNVHAHTETGSVTTVPIQISTAQLQDLLRSSIENTKVKH